VVRDAGAPAIQLRGRALERLLEIGARRVHLSLTHTRELAMAEVVLESS
jgi:phosphopantetheinyl transferase (holo-ACP synthase)